jgi:hypothetical protein
MATVALIAAAATTTGGLTALVVKTIHTTTETSAENFNTPTPRNGEEDGPESRVAS